MVVGVMRQRHLNRDFILDLLRIGQSSERTRKFAGSVPGHCGVCLASSKKKDKLLLSLDAATRAPFSLHKDSLCVDVGLWLASRLLLHNAQRSLSGLPW